MARPLRIEYAGALYHITARGNAQQNIYFSDDDRKHFLDDLARVCERYHWLCHAYCLMSNHYHLLVETNTPTLSKGMKLLNGAFTQYVNRTHRRVGHVFQGRYKAILVDKDAYLLELCRYVVLNPVRAEMVRSAKDWPWSSYRATAGMTLKGIPKPKKLAPPKPLEFYVENYPKGEGMARAYLSGHYTLTDVGDAFGKSYATVSRAVKAMELAEVE